MCVKIVPTRNLWSVSMPLGKRSEVYVYIFTIIAVVIIIKSIKNVKAIWLPYINCDWFSATCTYEECSY